jgi:hypothetical protein
LTRQKKAHASISGDAWIAYSATVYHIRVRQIGALCLISPPGGLKRINSPHVARMAFCPTCISRARIIAETADDAASDPSLSGNVEIPLQTASDIAELLDVNQVRKRTNAYGMIEEYERAQKRRAKGRIHTKIVKSSASVFPVSGGLPTLGKRR